MRYLEWQLSSVDVIPPRPAGFFFSHKVCRSTTVMSGGLPPSCHDVPGAQLRCRGFDPRSGPHTSAAQACPQSEVQRGAVAHAGFGLVCGEVLAKGRRVQPDAVEVLRETVGGGSRTSRLAPPPFTGPSRSAAPLESIEVSKSSADQPVMDLDAPNRVPLVSLPAAQSDVPYHLPEEGGACNKCCFKHAPNLDCPTSRPRPKLSSELPDALVEATPFVPMTTSSVIPPSSSS